MLTIYSTSLSANGRKVLAACHHLGLRPHIHEVNVYRGDGQKPEYLAINPSGQVPCLVDQRVTLTESNAILQYLSEAYGDCRLFSHDPVERAKISSWMFWEAAHWQPALSAVLAPKVGHALLPQAVPAPGAPPDWKHPQLLPLLQRLETQLAGQEFLVGGSCTLADLSVAGMATYLRFADFPFSRYRNLEAWYLRIEQMEAWKATANDLWT